MAELQFVERRSFLIRLRDTIFCCCRRRKEDVLDGADDIFVTRVYKSSSAMAVIGNQEIVAGFPYQGLPKHSKSDVFNAEKEAVQQKTRREAQRVFKKPMRERKPRRCAEIFEAGARRDDGGDLRGVEFDDSETLEGIWMGWLTAAGSLARTLGPVFVSQIYDAYGPRVTFIALIGIIVLTIIGLVVIFRRLVPYRNTKTIVVEEPA